MKYKIVHNFQRVYLHIEYLISIDGMRYLMGTFYNKKMLVKIHDFFDYDVINVISSWFLTSTKYFFSLKIYYGISNKVSQYRGDLSVLAPRSCVDSLLVAGQRGHGIPCSPSRKTYLCHLQRKTGVVHLISVND